LAELGSMQLPLARRFAIDSDRVVHETIDGETIIIHLESGTYYSLAGPGAEIWAMLAAGRSVGEVVDELRLRYEASTEELAHATAGLALELRREELLEDAAGGSDGEVSPDAGEGELSPDGTVADDSNGARAPFDSPELKKYTDMQYFLMLDPIHEVDGVGWPTPAGGQAAG
jgi:hypothetical protein